MRLLLLGAALACAGCCAPGRSRATAGDRTRGRDDYPSVSRGWRTHGTLARASTFPRTGPGFVRSDRSPNPGARHATGELVALLTRAAQRVEARHPGGLLVVRDLSLPRGGPLPHHASHQNGRDVDVFFYLLDSAGRPRPAKGIPIEPDGTGTDYRDLAIAADDIPVQLDVARTWCFFASLLRAGADGTRDVDLVQRIRIADHLRRRVIAHARAIGTPRALVARFEQVACQPRGQPHDDHAHIGIYCSADDLRQGCRDLPPLHSWRRRRLRAEGVPAPLTHPRRPKRRLRPTTSRTTARQAAGALHPDVRRFLERRERWATYDPSTGRKWCR